MSENPYEASQLHEPREPPAPSRPNSLLTCLSLLVITGAGLAGIMGGAYALMLVLPQARDSDYFIAWLGIATITGGVSLAVLAVTVFKRLLAWMGFG